jgi:outer membrane protein assembly factor BamB
LVTVTVGAASSAVARPAGTTALSTPAPTPSVPELGPFGSVDQFIAQQYVDAAGRAPTSSELAAARDGLNEHGETAGDFMAAVASGPGRAGQAAQVTRLYEGFLGRIASTDRFAYWRAQRAGGRTIQSVAEDFGSTAEFKARFPASLSQAAFVHALYETILGRTPTGSEAAPWVATLVKGTPRWRVALGFTESTEYRVDTADVASTWLAFAVMVRRMPRADEQPSYGTTAEANGYAGLATRLFATHAYVTRFPTPGIASTLQQDPAHDGNQPNGAVPLTARARWTHQFDNPVSYPVAAKGRVFVIVGGATGGGYNYGDRLYALSAATGEVLWGPLQVGGTYEFTRLTYDAGKVFTVDFDGLVHAVDAATGAPLWSAHLGSEYWVMAPPTAVDGTVYFVGNYGLYALDESTGAVRWTNASAGSDGDTAATVGGGQVFTEQACSVTHAVDAATGLSQWTYTTDCTGGGGAVAVLHDGLLYVTDYPGTHANSVLQVASGAPTGATFDSTSPPVFAGDLQFDFSSSTLRARSLTTGDVLWSQAADGTLAGAPVTAGGIVYEESTSGAVYGYDQTTGHQVWLGTPLISPPAGSETTQGPLAIAGNQLLAPIGNDLDAFG